MAVETITIRLEPEAAKVYRSAPPETRKKLQALLSLWLQELATADTGVLKQIMSNLSRKAQARGLTPEVLDSLLKGA